MDPKKQIVNQDEVDQCSLTGENSRCPAGKEIPMDQEISDSEASAAPEPMDLGEDG